MMLLSFVDIFLVLLLWSFAPTYQESFEWHRTSSRRQAGGSVLRPVPSAVRRARSTGTTSWTAAAKPKARDGRAGRWEFSLAICRENMVKDADTMEILQGKWRSCWKKWRTVGKSSNGLIGIEEGKKTDLTPARQGRFSPPAFPINWSNFSGGNWHLQETNRVSESRGSE